MNATVTDRERDVLLASLASQREHVLGILAGLAEEDFQRPVLPTGWNCVRLVNHLALDVERWWFHHIMAGEDTATALGESGWTAEDGLTGAAVLARYRAEIARADEVIAATSLDARPAWWPEGVFGSWRLGSAREILMHVIVETACHAGHLDAVRELLDGRTWLILE